MTFKEIYDKRKNLHDALIENESGLLELVQDLYPDTTHFIYEILQNAEDSKATTIEFSLLPDRLEIRHNGADFSIEDIGGITNVAGKKNEKKEDREKIGRFGIGFKSVYAITMLPHIQSGKFDFEIKNYLLPINFSDTNSFTETTITLPFNHLTRTSNEIFDLIKGKFDKLEHFNLLFLSNLNTITLKNGNQINTITKKGKEQQLKGSKIAYKVVITDNTSTNQYLLFKDDIVHEAFSVLKNKPKVSIAFKQNLIDDKYKIVKADSNKLFVFFETDYQTSLKFLLHAPFITTPARDNINFQEPINIALLDEIADLSKKALEYLSGNKLISVDFLNNLPIDSTITKQNLVYWKIFETIKGEFQSGKKYLPANNLLASASVVGLIRGKELKQILASKIDLQKLFNIDYWLDAEITQDKTPELRIYLMKELLIKEYGPEEFARVVTKEFFESKSISWIRSFYMFLNGKQQSLYGAGKGKDEGILRKKPFIRLSDGTHVQPFDTLGKPKVFLPVAKKKVPYATIHPDAISNKPSLEFVKDKLGIKEPDLIDEIRQHIIPLYAKDSPFPSHKDYRTHVEFVLDVYDKGKESVKAEIIELIKSDNIYFFKVIEFNSGTHYWGRADNTYFWSKQLEQYFRYTETVYFLNDSFYTSVSIELLHEIARKCGCKRHVRKVDFDPNFSEEKRRQLRLLSRYKSDEITWYQPWSVIDRSLQGFADFFGQEIISEEDSLLLWNILVDFLLYDTYKIGLFRGYYSWFRNSDRDTDFPTQILLMLKSKQWLYDKRGNKCRPSDLIITDLSQIYNLGTEEALFLIDKLQFKTEAENEFLNSMPEDKRNEFIEIQELIRLSKESGIDYKTLLEQKLGDEKRAEYLAELDNAPNVEDITPEEVDFKGFDNSGIEASTQEADAEKDSTESQGNMNQPNADGANGDAEDSKTKMPTQLPQDIKNKIGYRGERVVWLSLKKKWKKKYELIRETENEMEFKNQDGENYTIVHLNESGKKGIGCDILIKQGEQIYKYIEVKSSKSAEREYYSVSGYQWALAHKNYNQSIGNNYSIYVVTNVLSETPTITPIENPIKKWKDGKLRANPVYIEF